MTILTKFLTTLTFSFALIFIGGCDDDDSSSGVVKGVTLTPGSLSLAENVQSADYQVKLKVKPLDEDVVVTIASSETTVATVDPRL